MYVYQINEVRHDLIIFAEENEPLYKRGGRTPHVNSMALVIGGKSAALIDTGLGRGELDKLAAKYTKLPITVLTTHGDGDHTSGNHMFDTVYMSVLDDDLLKERTFAYKNISDGDIFDLGGVKLEAVAVPGHTKGSFCFYNRESNELFTGDSVNKLPWLFLERCTPLSVYHDSLVKLRGRIGAGASVYCGHSLTVFQYQVLTDSIKACEDVLNGGTENDLPYAMPFTADAPELPDVFDHRENDVHLIYNRTMMK